MGELAFLDDGRHFDGECIRFRGTDGDREVVWWMNQGRIEVRFDLRCTVIRRAKTRMGVTSWANEVSLSLSLSLGDSDLLLYA